MDPETVARYQDQLHEQLSGGSLGRLALMSLVMALVGSPILVVLHELGHAVVARRRGLQVPVLRLGRTPLLDLEVAGVQFELGLWLWLRWLDPRPSGTDGLGTEPEDILPVALAGPAVSLAVGVTALILATTASGTDDVGILLQLIGYAGTGAAIWSLVPRTGRRGDSDGKRALAAMTATRRRSVS